MKKTDVLVDEMFDEKLPTFISEENKHLFPEDLQFAFSYIKSRPIVFPKRYLRAQKGFIKRKIHKLYKKQPELSAKAVLMTMIAPLPDFIPSDMLSLLCTHILECWKAEQKKEKE